VLSEVSSSAVPPLEGWVTVDWQKLIQWVRRLMQRIYRAECQGNKRQVRNLQRLLVRSKAALLLSIRKITQINKGKRTAGIDGYKALTPQERVELYNRMKGMSITRHNPKPAKRTYIPKKKGKLRPLGIPTIIDRVYQSICSMALEPQWEARFEPVSYGFRPKRSTHDAIEAIFNKTSHTNSRQWVFEGDFSSCFDHLNHDYIMEQIRGFPYPKVIKRWLKAGYVDNRVFKDTPEGVPQGSSISPLLANIALHGMESDLGVTYRKQTNNAEVVYTVSSSHTLVRYADDFVILCRSREEAESMYAKLQPYLLKRGLELAEDKTRVTHITAGFDFLGFNIRKYKVNETKYKLLIKPSNESVRKAREKIREVFQQMRGNNVDALISKLNPIIRGCGNYWRHQVSKEAFSEMDDYVFRKAVKFLNNLHPTKSWKWKKKTLLQTRYTWAKQKQMAPNGTGQTNATDQDVMDIH
jgi:RNA-directed DNA polymerase